MGANQSVVEEQLGHNGDTTIVGPPDEIERADEIPDEPSACPKRQLFSSQSEEPLVRYENSERKRQRLLSIDSQDDSPQSEDGAESPYYEKQIDVSFAPSSKGLEIANAINMALIDWARARSPPTSQRFVRRYKSSVIELEVEIPPKPSTTEPNESNNGEQHIECLPEDRKIFVNNKNDLPQSITKCEKQKSSPTGKKKANPSKGRGLTYWSIRHYGSKRYQQACETNPSDLPYFQPCNHEDQCTLETCSCIQKGHFCTLDCVNGRDSTNFFRGCNCNGSCKYNNCSCRAANRECDPEVCQCNLCKKGTCMNANMILGSHPRVRIRESKIPGAGLGCFACNSFENGDFIGEYTGELLTEDEAIRREAVSEARGRNFLFTHSTDRVLDGKSLGNAMRFVNHSEKGYNAEPQVLLVRGYQRVGVYACKNIKELEEITMDYGKAYRESSTTLTVKEGV